MQCVKNMCDLLLGQIIIYRLNNRTNTYLRHEAFVTNSERHFLVKLHVNLVHNELNIEFSSFLQLPFTNIFLRPDPQTHINWSSLNLCKGFKQQWLQCDTVSLLLHFATDFQQYDTDLHGAKMKSNFKSFIHTSDKKKKKKGAEEKKNKPLILHFTNNNDVVLQ